LILALASVTALLTPRAWAQSEVVKVTFAQDREKAPAGGTVLVAVSYEHQEGWHIQPNAPVVPPELGDFEPFATTIKAVKPPAEISLGAIQWPEPVYLTVKFGDKPAKYGVYEHTAVALVPVILSSSASGTITIKLKTSFQACDDKTCVAPEDAMGTITITVDSGAPAQPDLNKAPFSAWKAVPIAAAGGEQPKAPQAKAPQADDGRLVFPFFAWKFSIDPRGVSGMLVLLGLAVCGGFLLNVMPCVLPVLPLKIVALSHAAGTRQRTLLLGIMMCAGVIAFWLGLGATIALSTGFKSASQIISTWWFSVGIGLLMIVMSGSLLGTFNVGVPEWAYAINPRHDTIHGSFLFGVLTAVLATPCVAPLAATAMGWAAFQPPATTMLVFSAIGIGMAIPYLVLAANPSWVSKVPRAGEGSEVMKQVMALLMLAVSAFFIGVGLRSLLVNRPYLGEALHWWFVAVLAGLASFWLIYRIWQIKAGAISRVVFTIVGLVIGGVAIEFALYQTELAKESYRAPNASLDTGTWKNYTPTAFDEARKAGKVVVVDFTAEWCLNCKGFEIILNDAEVREQLKGANVVAFKADLTSKTLADDSPNPAWAYMTSLKEVGPPVLVIYSAKSGEMFKANSYTKAVVLAEIANAHAN
jgi:thiol:disulfide interchange protein DsbD